MLFFSLECFNEITNANLFYSVSAAQIPQRGSK